MDSKKPDDNWSPWHHKLHKEFLHDRDLIPNKSELLIAVSGGQDSMALLNLINDIKIQHEWTINVWHGDHQWHEKSEYFAQELMRFCLQKNIPFFLDKVDNKDISSEEKARDWRYNKLGEKVDQLSIRTNKRTNIYILTGHTSTDNTETFLLNLCRGSNYNGLSGIRKKRLLDRKYYLVRPFLIFSREDTRDICQALEIPIWEDPSNSDVNIKRNLIRMHIMPNLERIYPGCTKRINGFIDKMNNYKNEQTDLVKLALISCSNKRGLDRLVFKNIGKEARGSLLNAFIKKKCLKQLSSKNINNLSAQIDQKENGYLNLPYGLRIIWDKYSINIKD